LEAERGIEDIIAIGYSTVLDKKTENEKTVGF
jgi:hypothetical protein